MKTQHSTCLLIPIIHLAIWGYNDKKNDLLPTFMEMYSTDLCCVFKMYWIVNFHFLLLKMRKRNKRYFLLTISKKSRFSPSETVIAFVMHSYKQKCQSPRKKVWSIVWKLESDSEEGKKFGFWELKEKGDLIPRGKYFRKLAYFHE